MTRHAELAAALAICLVGIALRMVQIAYNFDGDELFSARLAARPFGEVIRQSLENRPHPPLHNLLLFPWVRAFGGRGGVCSGVQNPLLGGIPGRSPSPSAPADAAGGQPSALWASWPFPPCMFRIAASRAAITWG